MTSFSTLSIPAKLADGLARAGFTEMKPVQAQSVPHILNHKDVLVRAKTGSGKTLAFAIGCLAQLDVDDLRPQGLVLCPTRELAEQVAEQIRLAAKGMPNVKVVTLYGGMPMGQQISSIKHGAHIVVGTPGRVMDHVTKRRLDFSQLKCRVLDEADRMFDMGFADDLEIIFGAIPHKVQTLLFSATYTDQVKGLAQQILHQPEHIEVEQQVANSDITQFAYKVVEGQKTAALKALLTHHQPASTIVFCNTKAQVKDVFFALQDEGFGVAQLHGDLEQNERNDVLMLLKSKAINVLIASDVAARGLDIPEVDCVVSYTVSEDVDAHTHRIGRTGRNDTKGEAIVLFEEKEQAFLEKIEHFHEVKIPVKGIQALRFHKNRIVQPEFQCIVVNAGKKAKLRPMDFVGALTQDADIPGDDLGKITVQANQSFIAVKVRSVKRALALFRDGKIKGKRARARKISAR